VSERLVGMALTVTNTSHRKESAPASGRGPIDLGMPLKPDSSVVNTLGI
jgi:hypothetical protein